MNGSIWVGFLLVIFELCCVLIALNDNGECKQWIHYSRLELLAIRDALSSNGIVFNSDENIINSTQIIDENVRTDRFKPKRKRGRRSGVYVRTKRRGYRPPLPTMMCGNVRSLRNKIDELCASCQFNRDYKDSCMICLTETWLEERDADGTMQIDNFNIFRGDRKSTSKQRGGGVCIYVNEKWCKNVTIKDSYCDDNLEYLTVSCRPFYLPREFNNIIITVAYVPPNGDYKLAAELLANCVSNMDDQCPKGINILTGDFNGCNVSELLPNYYQYVKCATRGSNILDLVFCNVKQAFKILKRPPLGNSDHNMLLCLPTYVQKLKSEKCKVINVKQWSETNIDMLKACFDCTDWEVLYDDSSNLNENVDVCTSYIQFCIDLVIPTKSVTAFPNNKAWVTKEVKSIINKKKYALSHGRSEIKSIQKELNLTIKNAKHTYKEKVENMFRTNKAHDAWKGLKCLSGFVTKCAMPEPDDVNLYVNELNAFYARFDCYDSHVECNEILSLVNNRVCEPIILTENEVLCALNTAKPGKACGPDKINGQIVKSCSRELVKPMHKLFQETLNQCEVPILWKTSEVIPVPKIKIPLEKNDLRPIALTSVFMKCLEFIIKKLLLCQSGLSTDSLQFAYKQKRCVEDAICTLLDTICLHLDKEKTYSRIVYVDFSSTFNTIQPHIMLQKLYKMNVNSSLIKWIFSYLVRRVQYVKFNGAKSKCVITNTGAPQGCVLSPLLFTLYTDDCRSEYDDCTIIKYADDTVIIGNITDNNETNYLRQVDIFVTWCDSNFLNLNVKKTKEMFLDFRKIKNDYMDLSVKNENVEVVNSYKYLGVIIDDKLSFSDNAQHVYKKGIQRIHYLRILKDINVDRKILCLFYKSIIESVLIFGIITWFGSAKKKDQNKLSKIVRIARKKGVEARSLQDLYNDVLLKLATKIIDDPLHPLHKSFLFLRSGRRLSVPKHRTSRYGKTFIPSAIKLYNHKLSSRT